MRISLILPIIFAASMAHGQTAGIKAECNLLEAAYKTTQNSGVKPFSDILVGCPDYENLTAQMSRRDNAKAFRKAASHCRKLSIRFGCIKSGPLPA